MRLYAITDGKCLDTQLCNLERLRGLVIGWIEGGVEFIQLREKELNRSQLASLVEEISTGIDRRQTRLLINLPASSAWLKAFACVADGVHIPGRPKPGTAGLVRRIFAGSGGDAIVSIACHSVEEVRLARADGADLVLFAPVFEKPVSGSATGLRGQGLDALRRACEAARDLPVFALGGVTAANAAECLAAGAVGVGGIRLFAEASWRGALQRRGTAGIATDI